MIANEEKYHLYKLIFMLLLIQPTSVSDNNCLTLISIGWISLFIEIFLFTHFNMKLHIT